MGAVILVTGVARPLAAMLARRLLDHAGVSRVVGVDVTPPTADLGGAEFVRADVRDPMIGTLIASCAADTIVHTGVRPHSGGRAAQKESNVIGAMQLLAACQRTARVGKLVLCSTTARYGASPRDPALFREDAEPALPPGSGLAKDAVEVEAYVRGFSRRRPDVTVTILRLADILGVPASSPLASYLSLPVWPTVLGFDPRFQVLHPLDAVAVAGEAATAERPGVFNVAGDGVLSLSQAARRLARPTVPIAAPVLDYARPLLRKLGADSLSIEQVKLLTYGRAVDTTRLRQTFGHVPTHSTASAFEEFASALASRGPHLSEPCARAHGWLGALAAAGGRDHDG